MLYRVAESVVVLLCLGLELTAQTLVESLKVIALLLKRHLDRLCLLACVGILLHLLLEVGSCSLQSLLLCEGVLDILALLLKDERVVLAELVLRHDTVYLYISNLSCSSCSLGCRFLIVYLRL